MVMMGKKKEIKLVHRSGKQQKQRSSFQELYSMLKHLEILRLLGMDFNSISS